MGPQQDRSTVTVLGAGVAGLATGWELERLGYRVEVLEGSGRLGGRVYTYRFGTAAGAPVAELGAMRIPATHRRVLDYVDRRADAPSPSAPCRPARGASRCPGPACSAAASGGGAQGW
jgi:monoamine oxidase